MINVLDYFLLYIMEALKSFELLKETPTFMAYVCNDLKIYENTKCVEWFTQATNHCFQLTFAKQKKSSIWDILQEILFEAENFSLVSPNSINRHPTHLSSLECEKLLIEVNKDYLNKLIPREKKLITEFWQFVSLISTLLLLFICLKIVQIIVKAIRTRKNKQIEVLNNVFKSPKNDEYEKKEHFWINHCVPTMKYEVQHLKVYHQLQLEHLFLNREVPTLLLKNLTKYSFIHNIVHGECSTIGRFYNLSKKEVKSDGKTHFTATTTAHKVLEYINKFNKRPLQILVIFDEDEEFEENIPSIPHTRTKHSSYKREFDDKIPLVPYTQTKPFSYKRISICKRESLTDMRPLPNAFKSIKGHMFPLPKVLPKKYERSGSESQICSRVSTVRSAIQLQHPNTPASANGILKRQYLRNNTSRISFALDKEYEL